MTEEIVSQEENENELVEETNPTEEIALEPNEICALVEALIFASLEPLSIERIIQVSGLSKEDIERSLEELQARSLEENTGIELVCVAGKYQYRTKARYAGFIRDLRAGRPRRLSLQALETLAIVAYRQPIVKSDIEKIRGVDATPTLKTLLDRQIIKIVGHQNTVGQPALYGTTEEFLKLFGLASLTELPTLRDLKELDDPGEDVEVGNADFDQHEQSQDVQSQDAQSQDSELQAD